MQVRYVFGMCLVFASTFAGCGMNVTPPSTPDDPVSVFVADHGIHTSLVLPREDGTLVHYSYSRFDWAALDLDQWYRSLPALMIPGPGTVGTRDFPGPDTLENVAHEFEITNNHPPVQAIYPITVSAATCRETLARLDARWNENASTAVTNQKRGLRFVKDSTSYSLFHNCNHEVASWLRELGCQVDGAAMTADVYVRPAPVPKRARLEAAGGRKADPSTSQ